MNPTPAGYRTFVLRLWREAKAEFSPWRFVLVNPNTGERQAFTEVEHLVMFLQKQMGEHESQQREFIQNLGD